MRRFFQKKEVLWAVFGLAALAVSIQKYSHGRGPNGYTSYENYLIFKQSYAHLAAGLNPYVAYPAEQWDLFKYSPAFAVLMAPFAPLPDWLGLIFWNALNALLLLAALLALPFLSEKNRALAAWLVLIELVTSLQNSQSNGLTAALMLGTFVLLDRQKPAWAALFVAVSGHIKIFGIFAALLALLFPRQKTFAAWLGVWMLAIGCLPFLLLPPGQVLTVYGQWFEALRSDHGISTGLSVMGWMETWFGLKFSKISVLAVGLAILTGSFAAAFFSKNREKLRSTALSNVLIWVVIFNHRAESPTFVIAMSGVAIWFLTGEKRVWEKILLALALLFTVLSPTDIFPKTLREGVVQPYVLKAVPCIIIWFLTTYNLIRGATTRSNTSVSDGIEQ